MHEFHERKRSLKNWGSSRTPIDILPIAEEIAAASGQKPTSCISPAIDQALWWAGERARLFGSGYLRLRRDRVFKVLNRDGAKVVIGVSRFSDPIGTFLLREQAQGLTNRINNLPARRS